MDNDKLIKICPNPSKWNDIYISLCKIYDKQSRTIPKPPVPLILAGWGFSDRDKFDQWNETLNWISRFCDSSFILNLADQDYYTVTHISNTGYWDIEANYKYGHTKNPAVKPSKDELDRLMSLLIFNWPEVAGEMASYIKVIKFTGSKARKLYIQADKNRQPPWGKWNGEWGRGNHRENYPAFAIFRERINELIKPHEVDYIEFNLNSFNG